MNTLYGIKNCDTVKKARSWLEQHAIAYQFHDFRTDGLLEAQVTAWHSALGDALINRRSTTWKQLAETQRKRAETAPVALLVEHPTLIKRPLLNVDETYHVGFKTELYSRLFNTKD